MIELFDATTTAGARAALASEVADSATRHLRLLQHAQTFELMMHVGARALGVILTESASDDDSLGKRAIGGDAMHLAHGACLSALSDALISRGLRPAEKDDNETA